MKKIFEGDLFKDKKKLLLNISFIFSFPLLIYIFLILVEVLAFGNGEFQFLRTFIPNKWYQYILVILYFPLSLFILQKYDKRDFIRYESKKIFEKFPLFIILISILSCLSFLFLNKWDFNFTDDILVVIIFVVVLIIIGIYPFFEIKELSILRKIALFVKIDIINNIIAFMLMPVILIGESIIKKDRSILALIVAILVILGVLLLSFFLWYGIRILEKIKYDIKTSVKILLKEIIYIIKKTYYFWAVMIIPIAAGYFFYFFQQYIAPSFPDNRSAMYGFVTFLNNIIYFIS